MHSPSAKTLRLLRIARLSAFLSLLGGFGILGLHYLTGGFEGTGLLFLFIAFLFNASLLLILLYQAVEKPGARTALLGHAALLLLNVPAALLCLHLNLYWSSYLRLTLVNDTGAAISEVRLYGCEGHAIPAMAAGERRTVWIYLGNDCVVGLRYRKAGMLVEEPVSGYETNSGGRPAKYRIGKPNGGRL